MVLNKIIRGNVIDFLDLIGAGKSAGCCVFGAIVDGDGTDPHLLQPLDLHFADKGVPSRHLVEPSIQSTPP